MTIGFLFWLLMILWLIFGVVGPNWPPNGRGWFPICGSFLLWVLLFLLGWRVFGFPIQG